MLILTLHCREQKNLPTLPDWRFKMGIAGQGYCILILSIFHLYAVTAQYIAGDRKKGCACVPVDEHYSLIERLLYAERTE